MFNELLSSTKDSLLQSLDQKCAEKNANLFEIFNQIEDDLWSILLLKEYTLYPNIKKLLPDLPPPDLQERWVGSSGVFLASQTLDFYNKLKVYFCRYGNKPLNDARILDFGCGWGRIIRYFAKDTPEKHLFGCDPNHYIVEQCLDSRVPGTFKVSEPRPKSLPFDGKFDLIYAFSVFTHLSEKTHLECLEVLHDRLTSDGLLCVTILPKSIIRKRGLTFQLLNDQEIENCIAAYDSGQYIFLGHKSAIVNGEDTYGDTCIPLSYIEEHWTKLFSIVGSSLSLRDQEQFLIVCKKRVS
jgi:hypothetical protein